MAPRPLLIPSLLDDWFPLLQYAFASDAWEPVLLTETQGLADLGLRHFHNEMCYPAILVAGQILAALSSGKYDVARCGVLMGQAGDECRGSCGIRMMRKALDRAGFPQVPLLSLNVRGIDRDAGLPIRPAMVWQGLAGAVWGDTLAILRDQTRPREAVPGTAEALWRRWMAELGGDIRAGRGLSRSAILARCREMAASFRAVEQTARPVQKVAVVGEIYTKYCHLGNWDLEAYLAAEHCEIGVGGITWYALYYMDTHALKGSAVQRAFYRAVQRYAAGVQRDMLGILRGAGFVTLPPFAELKRQAEGYAPLHVTVADGWLITAEAAAWARLGYRKILCVQPFACLPGHIFGKGQYAALQRKLPHARLVSVDYDASTGEGTVQSRVRMLLDERLDEVAP
ncbi:2-hydroxyacyl-CoA dehydratase [uncultured Dysosmobacter sp.]|uniref:2-hydroxyacyl-CoA dehydratase n=1 Tax=uncultured Dysosmobacter sp. TaxID=2591384 RepID=UPI002604743B|nr:2-hydroxyacyl-CoA dehydratase [uncultured Dysosmobacter sp.]